MITYRPILFIVGILLSILAVAMVVPALLDFIMGDINWVYFALACGTTGFFGVLLTLAYRSSEREELGVRETFLLTVACWVSLAVFASLPFIFSEAAGTTTDALFEAVSGLTTTGASVFTGLDQMSAGHLLWRALLQWLGGIGIVVMALTILPTLQIGGMQLFQSEFSDRSEKMLPRVSQIASAILSAYLLLSISCALLYWMAGMSPFEAICNMMTTVSTAGFSTGDASFQTFNNPMLELIAMVFMLIGGCTLILFIRLLHGEGKYFFGDSQIRSFFAIISIAIVVVVSWLWYSETYTFIEALRYGTFNVISILTTTGFSSADYSQWGSFGVVFLFFLMFVGGCTGSTSGGMKVFRFQILYEAAKVQIAQLRHPHGVFIPSYNGKPVNEKAFLSVLAFFALYILCYGALAIGLALCELDWLTSVSGSAAIMGNVGPALGEAIGPAGNFSSLPDGAKWMMMLGMLVGRLELLTIIILFTPGFWRG